jgi:ATP-dependent helicase/nuclease subunit B
VDYKTGVKSLSLSNIWYGMGLQMLIYLFALERCGESYYGRPIVPAGVLYAPARESYLTLSRNITEQELLKERIKAVRRSGLILNDEEVIDAMAHSDGRAYLPVKFTKDGKATGDSLATMEQLGALAKHIDEKLIQIGHELHSGQVAADPFYRSQVDNACQYCDYRQACHFDEENGDRVRYLTKLKTHEAWQKMMGQGTVDNG